ncbi:uncharacterized protein LOC112087606 [Eutrema salsugineum]|uniref:uncharacterized protein LOC112087606 n=1 Tax=Eutrema salsugineum TaxID=72664 RepID=UPI000CED0EB7|nr:uncharacterized protein LOC112087606 [Eutrema salsugineum]
MSIVPAFEPLFPSDSDVDSDGEDKRERNNYNVEEVVSQFRDESPIRHNDYPETDFDEGDEVKRTAKRRNNIPRGNGNLYFGQVFMNGIAFKEAVLDHALKTGRNIRQKKYDKNKLSFSCEGIGCSWHINCSISGKTSRWQVTVFKEPHTCVPNGVCTMLKVPQIARLFVDKIREEPEYYMPMKIEEMVMEKWKISVTRPQCQHARIKALRCIDREYAEQFSRLRDYKAEIEETNPGSSVEVDCVRNEAGQDVFQRFYVCFNVLRRTWKETCRPLIGVDGCFLKSVQKGELFVAMGRDADNAIYPIAWAVVQKENTDNWQWFFTKIKADLGLEDGDGYVLVSDRQKGLINVVMQVLPKIEHRMCVRHIYMNVKSRHSKMPELKTYIWRLAQSYNEADFRINLRKIEDWDARVYADIKKSKPETWCRAFYKFGPYCEDVENNSTESFNNSIGKARDKALVPMLEAIARLAMVRIAKRDIKATKHEGVCTPYVIDYLAELHEKASECFIKPSTNRMYEAKLNGCSHYVNLAHWTCSCKRWDITGIPCEHAYGVMLRKGLEAQDYVCHWFRTTTWRRNYTDEIVPIRGAKFWPNTDEPSIIQPEVPDMPGRQKVTKADKKRKKDKNESPVKKANKLLKRVMHCKICGEANHNSRFHKKKPKTNAASSQAEASSQVEVSQGVTTQI